MNILDIQKAVIKIIKENLGVDYKIFLFGSWAKGNALPQSDLDIAIYGVEKVLWSKMVKIINLVEEIPTLRKIEVIDLRDKSLSFQESVMRYAKLITA